MDASDEGTGSPIRRKSEVYTGGGHLLRCGEFVESNTHDEEVYRGCGQQMPMVNLNSAWAIHGAGKVAGRRAKTATR